MNRGQFQAIQDLEAQLERDLAALSLGSKPNTQGPAFGFSKPKPQTQAMAFPEPEDDQLPRSKPRPSAQPELPEKRIVVGKNTIVQKKDVKKEVKKTIPCGRSFEVDEADFADLVNDLPRKVTPPLKKTNKDFASKRMSKSANLQTAKTKRNKSEKSVKKNNMKSGIKVNKKNEISFSKSIISSKSVNVRRQSKSIGKEKGKVNKKEVKDVILKKIEESKKKIGTKKLQKDLAKSKRMNLDMSVDFHRTKSRASATLNRSFVSQKSLKIKQFDQDLVFKPMLSKKSLQIAEKLRPSYERLVESQKRNVLRDEEIEEIMRREAQPKINKRSQFIDQKNNHNMMKRFQKLYEDVRIKNEKMNEKLEKKKQEEAEKEQLISNHSRSPQLSKNNSKYFTSDVNVIERNKLWKARHEERLEKQRRENKEQELKDCKFKPDTTTFDPSILSQASSSKFVAEGLSEHLRRAELAKRLRSEKSMNASRDKNLDSFMGDSKYLSNSNSGYLKKHQNRSSDKIIRTEREILTNFDQDEPNDKSAKLKTMFANLKKLNNSRVI